MWRCGRVMDRARRSRRLWRRFGWLCAHEEALVVTTAPSDRQVKELLWREIRAPLSEEPGTVIGGKLTSRLVWSFRKSVSRYGFLVEQRG